MKARARAARKAVPRFSTEDEERRFWSGHDTVDYFDWGKAVRARFPELRPSTATISLRLPASMLDELKALANARDVPYQSLLKVFLAERIATERGMRRKVPA
jgi:predicted DNA binding CopG/RHH family protein